MNIEARPLTLNFTHGRGGVKPDVIVVHIMEGTMTGTDSWFRSPESKVSAHYGVSRTGEVVRWLDDEDTGWHAGKVHKPTAAIVKEREGKSPNAYSIGIENEGKATDEPTEAQLAALAELVKELAAKHSIPLTRRHIIGHREIRSDKTCPGKIDVDDVVQRALAIAQAPARDTETVAALNNLESHLLASLAEVDRIRKQLP